MDRTDHRIDCISNPHSPRSNILHGPLNQGRQPHRLPSFIKIREHEIAAVLAVREDVILSAFEYPVLFLIAYVFAFFLIAFAVKGPAGGC